MKAIVCTKYGPPEALQLAEMAKPEPGDNEVLVKIHAASINWADVALSTGQPFVARLTGGGLQKPKNPIPGADIAGRVEAVGRNVRQFRPGDEVFGDLSGCGFGAFAEYVAVPETELALKPTNLSFEQAVTAPEAAVVALQGLRDIGRIRAGHKVLISGASGGIGTFAVQIAKSFGAEVTGVCSAKNADLVRSLGADHVIDYTHEDFTRNDKRYDLIAATAGFRPLLDYRRALNPGGVYVAIGGSMKQIFRCLLFGPVVSMFGSRKLKSLSAKPKQQDLVFVSGLLEAGKVVPVIDSCYPLDHIAEAMRRYATGRTRGKIVITIA